MQLYRVFLRRKVIGSVLNPETNAYEDCVTYKEMEISSLPHRTALMYRDKCGDAFLRMEEYTIAPEGGKKEARTYSDSYKSNSDAVRSPKRDRQASPAATNAPDSTYADLVNQMNSAA